VRGLARGGRVHASQASPHRVRARKALHAGISGLFGFWPHFVCDRFFFALCCCRWACIDLIAGVGREFVLAWAASGCLHAVGACPDETCAASI